MTTRTSPDDAAGGSGPRRCLVCAAPFPGNDVLEHLPRGRRVAFDSGRGRLWVVCGSCRRWSLVPMEDRWEAIEELEKAVRDRGKLLSTTDTIALLTVDDIEVVQVGRASRAEEAWWRYGRELVQRRRSYGKLTAVAGAATSAVVVGGWAAGGVSLIGAWWLWSQAPDGIKRGARWLRFGSAAWRGRAVCARCGHEFRNVSYAERQSVVLLPHAGGAPGAVAGRVSGGDGSARASEAGAAPEVAAAGEHPGRFDVALRCPRCGSLDDGGLRLAGRDAERTIQRVLAYHHFDGASENRVRSASRLIEEAGSPDNLTRILLRDGRRVGDLQRTGAIALEIAAHESSEQQLLEMQLAELETVWRREEELAGIIDGELTEVPLLEGLRRRVTGRG